jgi:acyl-CoA thioesterase
MNAVPAPDWVEDLANSLGQEGLPQMDGEAGRAVISYRAQPRMCHSGGVVQGGFVAGWLDAAMAHAIMAVTGAEIAPMTLELKVSYFAPANPGLVVAEGWVERRGRATCFLEGRLTNAAGEVLAKATSTARLIPRAKVQARATGQEA